MDAISEILSRGLEQLLGRSGGPLHLRLVIQPVVASILAIRAGLRDAREGQPAFFWIALTDVAERKRLLRSGLKDIGKVCLIALVLDFVYQIIALRAFYIIQTLVVVTVIAVIPYILIRGLVTSLAPDLSKKVEPMKTPPQTKGKEPTLPVRLEPRWPVILAILAVLLVLALTPSRARLLPSWFAYVLGIIPILPMIGVWLGGPNARWLSIERTTTLVFSVVAEAVTLTALMHLIREMMDKPDSLSGRQLLTSSIAAWVTNVLAFSLVYWQIDRGGPETRANEKGRKGDWLFPQNEVPEEAQPDWRPTFVDYLSMAFTTATAFSASDTMPLTPRAKILMMIEIAVSLATLVLVASRAINLLGN